MYDASWYCIPCLKCEGTINLTSDQINKVCHHFVCCQSVQSANSSDTAPAKTFSKQQHTVVLTPDFTVQETFGVLSNFLFWMQLCCYRVGGKIVQAAKSSCTTMEAPSFPVSTGRELPKKVQAAKSSCTPMDAPSFPVSTGKQNCPRELPHWCDHCSEYTLITCFKLKFSTALAVLQWI